MIKGQILEYAKKHKVFTTDDIASDLNIQESDRLYLNTLLSRLCKEFTIVRYEKGIYGYAEYNPLFKKRSHIPYDDAMAAIYLNDSNGYITGADFLYAIGLTTWYPSKKMIVSNKVTKTKRTGNLIILPPKETITHENLSYLQFLDGIQQMENLSVDNENPSHVLMRYIKKKLDLQRLIVTAVKLYPEKILKRLIRIMEEDYDETA